MIEEQERTPLVKDLVGEHDKILREETPKFDFNDPPMDPVGLAHMLAQSCIYYGGLGLAAPQIGLPYRACIIKANPMICMFNPKIVGTSEEADFGEEGCLTFFNLIIKIKRYQVIRVRFTRPNNETVTERYEGMTARIVQHEIDHLDGILFQRRANDVHLSQAKKQRRRLEKAGHKMAVHPDLLTDDPKNLLTSEDSS